jgi:DNA-binding LytR/AlgR family response regulator
MTAVRTKLRTIIVDDNPADLLALKKVISEDVDLIGEAGSANECLELLEQNEEVDLLLLDIDMPGMSGVELADMILGYDNPPQIAFITGRTDYAVKAFDLSLLDYVVKPFDRARIEQTLDKAIEHKEAKTYSSSNLESAIKVLLEEQNKKSNDRLPVKDYKERTIRFIQPKSIVFAQRDSRKVNIATETETFPTYYTIDKLEERLKNHGFYKANSGLIVNIDFVEHMIPNGDGSYDLILSIRKEELITVSRSCSKAILSKLSV